MLVRFAQIRARKSKQNFYANAMRDSPLTLSSRTSNSFGSWKMVEVVRERSDQRPIFIHGKQTVVAWRCCSSLADHSRSGRHYHYHHLREWSSKSRCPMDLLVSNSDIQTLNTYSGSDLCHRIHRTLTTTSRSVHHRHSYVNGRKTDRPVKSLALRQNMCFLPLSSSVEAMELTECREDDGAREGALCSSGCSVIFGKRLRAAFGGPREGWIILNEKVVFDCVWNRCCNRIV